MGEYDVPVDEAEAQELVLADQDMVMAPNAEQVPQPFTDGQEGTGTARGGQSGGKTGKGGGRLTLSKLRFLRGAYSRRFRSWFFEKFPNIFSGSSKAEFHAELKKASFVGLGLPEAFKIAFEVDISSLY